MLRPDALMLRQAQHDTIISRFRNYETDIMPRPAAVLAHVTQARSSDANNAGKTVGQIVILSPVEG